MNNNKKMRIAFTWPKNPIIEGARDLESSLEELILSATNSIDILTYTYSKKQKFILNEALSSIINDSRGCNLKIRFFLNYKKDAKKILKDKKYFSNVNLECWYWHYPEDDYSKFHIKSVLVDKFKIYLGSANWGETAMNESAECGMFFTCRETTNSIKKYLKSLINQGLLIKYES